MSATNRGAKREERDFYPTPLTAFVPLLTHIKQFSAGLTVWEPACGDGRLIRCMRSELITTDWDDLKNGYDFLKDETRRHCIVTNPPFSLAQEFVEHAVSHSPSVFLLLRLNFLGGQKRYDWWNQHEPDALFILSQRPSFTGQGTDACEYAWFYWGENHKGIHHLRPQPL